MLTHVPLTGLRPKPRSPLPGRGGRGRPAPRRPKREILSRIEGESEAGVAGISLCERVQMVITLLGGPTLKRSQRAIIKVLDASRGHRDLCLLLDSTTAYAVAWNIDDGEALYQPVRPAGSTRFLFSATA